MNKPNNTKTTISSIMAGIIMVVSTMSILFVVGVTNNMMMTPAYAEEKYDPEQSYTREECAEMFDPKYDRENYLGCSGSIGGSWFD
jgi:hypothetical protein